MAIPESVEHLKECSETFYTSICKQYPFCDNCEKDKCVTSCPQCLNEKWATEYEAILHKAIHAIEQIQMVSGYTGECGFAAVNEFRETLNKMAGGK